MRKAVHVVISSVLIFFIILVTVMITYLWGMPIVEKSKDSAIFESMKVNMNSLCETIKTVSREGEGSERIFILHIVKGRIYFNGTSDLIFYELDTRANVVEQNFTVHEGNLEICGKKSPHGGVIAQIIINCTKFNVDLIANASLGKGYFNISLINLGLDNSKTMIEVRT